MKKSLFFVSLPKSGTVYSWTCLSEMTGLKIPEFHLMEGWREYNKGRDFSIPNLYACGDYNTQLLRPEQMKEYLNGFVFGAHMQASYHNIRVLEELGIDRVTVLLRDPRDAFVSWVHHLRSLGAGARDYHSKIYHIPRDYFDWTLERQFDYQLRTFFPTIVNWVEGWLDLYADPGRTIDLLFVFYDELKNNPRDYIRKIVEFHGITDVDYSKLVQPQAGQLHYRRGEHGQWRSDLSARNRELAREIMQDRIAAGFRAAAAHPQRAAANRALAGGDIATAADSACAVLTQFCFDRDAYGLLSRAAGRTGVATAGFEEKVNARFGKMSCEDYFRYDQAMVEESYALRNMIKNAILNSG